MLQHENITVREKSQTQDRLAYEPTYMKGLE